MNLAQQIQALIEGAPDPESRSSVMAIAPILQQVAANLPQTEYYICQSHRGEWAITSLRHRQQPNLEINVIYAFTRIQDLNSFTQGESVAELAVKMPVIQLLFDLLAFPEIDRIVFLNDSQNLNLGREILRQELEEAIVKDLQQPTPPSSLPPDIC
jgi:hypothetical protein